MSAGTVAAWYPSVDQVAALLRARTQDQFMREAGTFLPASADPNDPQTRPTEEQVDELIALAAPAFEAEVRIGICDAANAAGIAGHLALTVALMVELGYFPEQVATGRSPYDQLLALWEAQHANVVESVQWACGTTDGEGGDGGTDDQGRPIAMPSWSYPGLDGDPRAPGAEYQVTWEGWIGRDAAVARWLMGRDTWPVS